MRRSLLAVTVLLLACGGAADGGPEPPASPGAPSQPPGASARMLVVTHTAGFRHDSIPVAETVIRDLGTTSGLFTAEFCRTADDVRARMTPTGLAGFDGVVFANTTGNLGIPDPEAFLDWVAAGKAFVGVHSASDTYHDLPRYGQMLGGQFTTHGDIVEAEIQVDAPAHPAVAHLGSRFRMSDEWYRFRNLDPGMTVLLSFDRNPPDGLGTPGEPADLPLAWHKPFGSGRVFYTALGHRVEVWNDERFRRHLLEGIRWALGR